MSLTLTTSMSQQHDKDKIKQDLAKSTVYIYNVWDQIKTIQVTQYYCPGTKYGKNKYIKE